MRAFLAILLSLIYTNLLGQVSITSNLNDSALFTGKYKGNVQYLYTWKDKLGDNWLLLTITQESKTNKKLAAKSDECVDNCTDIELYAYHFISKDSLLWKVQDFERACAWDNVVEFRRNSIKITDLDQNGIAEVWLMYSLICTSDVSPSTLKLIMYQERKKAVVRGTSQPAKNMLDKEYGGKFQPDNQFLKLPKRLQEFGEKLWKKNLFDIE